LAELDVRALVLAAGAGRRFGGPKQLAPVDGEPMLARVLALAEGWRPVLVLGAHADEILAAVDTSRVDVVRCADWEEGQAASLRAGARGIGSADAAVVLLGDQPYLVPEAIDGVVEAWEPAGADAVRATYDGRPGHPTLLGRRVLDAVPALRGDTGARELLGRFRVQTWEAGHLADPTDIDTPDQLEVVAR
jgi:CTP:molybdopterin cytidylyltransferase MocA